MAQAQAVINITVKVLLYVAMVVLTAMMLLTVLDVGGRYLLNRPIIGSTEITTVMIATLSFLALLWCTREKMHIRLDLMSGYLPDKFQAISDIVYYLLGSGLFTLIAWQNFLMGRHNFIENYTSWVLNIPNYPFYFAVSASCAIVALMLLLFTVQNITIIVRKWT